MKRKRPSNQVIIEAYINSDFQQKAAAKALEVTVRALRNWLNRDKELKEGINQARDEAALMKISPHREPFYKTPFEMLPKIKAYFDSDLCDYTITGLALALGFASRSSIYDYVEKPAFTYILKSAVLRIENAYEGRLIKGKGSAAGGIFVLKNLGWVDESRVKNESLFYELTDEQLEERIHNLISPK